MPEGEIYDSEGVRIQLQEEGFTDELYKAFDKYIQILEAQFAKEISKPQFDWPRATERGKHRSKKSRDKDPRIIGSPRDIVDTGSLRESISVSAGLNKSNRGSVSFVWNAPYSAAVLKGYKKKQQWPARDWIAKALKIKPPVETMRKLLGGAT